MTSPVRALEGKHVFAHRAALPGPGDRGPGGLASPVRRMAGGSSGA